MSRQPKDGLQDAPLPGFIRPRERRGPLPLSFAQQQFWLLQQIAPDSAAYQHHLSLRLPPTLDVAALQRSLEALIGRHEAWRTSFPLVDGQPIQRIHPPSVFDLSFTDLSQLPAALQEARLEQLLQHLKRPFDLQEIPPMRAALVALGTRGYRLCITLHHILYDGHALEQVFLSELVMLYQAFAAGHASPLPPLPIQYADFALWQRETLSAQALKSHLAYWKERLVGVSTSLNLSTDASRPPASRHRAAHVFFPLPGFLRSALLTLGLQERATLFMTGLAAWGALLSRYSGQQDLVIGTPATLRKYPELEGLLGVCINTLALRLDLSGDPSFRILLRRARQATLSALDHDEVPFEDVVKALQPERELGQNPLFQTMFSLEQPMPPLAAGWTVDEQTVPADAAAVDVRLALVDRGAEIVGYVEYDPDLWEAATMERLTRHFQTLLHGIVADPDRPLSAVSLLDERERHQLLVEWNATARTYPKEQPVHRLFEAQAERTPEAVALIAEADTLTYRALNQRANQFAQHLRALGVGPDVLVGLCMERSIEMVVGLLGILKAGGAYLPLEPTYPKERLAFMLEDSQAPVLVTSQSCLAALPTYQGTILCLDRDWSRFALEPRENLAGGATARNLAYVMYTSGSTGRPKGVEIQHSNIVRLVCGVDYAELDATTTLLHLSPIAFDASTFEVWGALLNGGRCVLYPERIPTPQGIGAAIEKHRVTTVFLTTALFNAVIDQAPEALKNATLVMTGGEALSVPHIRRALDTLPTTQLLNVYGPTEGTTYTTYYPIPRSFDATRRSVPIGRPIANTQVYVLDAHLQPVPVGVPGELYIGGDGLARGYLHRPELTAERFLAHPCNREPSARLYKTGDLVRWLPDGNLEFLGRTDDQVKIRGFRIELGEIEAVLGQHPEVREAVVVVLERAGGDKRLVAYLIPAQTDMAPPAELLRSFLRDRLPDYMVPAAFIWLDRFPLTPIGKIDRRALPAPDQFALAAPQRFVAPCTATEKHLAALWEELLEGGPVGRNANFFELGGHSLLATRLIARLSGDLSVTLPIRWLFQYPTIAELAAAIDQAFPAVGPQVRTQAGQTDQRSIPPSSVESGAVTLETRPLLSLLLSGEIPPVEAVALGYLSDETVPAERREAVRNQLFQGLPVLTSVLSTPSGHIGVMTLPLFAQELYTDQNHLVRLCGQARTMAKAIGARAMALTGLLPSATDYGQALPGVADADSGVRVTTGHATTTAAVVATIGRILREAGRDLADERVAFVGMGSVGSATLRLMLSVLPHPAALLLCDLYAKRATLEAMRQEARDAGFRGELHLLEADGLSLPDAVYAATVVVGATNVGNVLDMAQVRPGVLIVDDSGPHCFDPERAIGRFETRGDILFTEGGALLSPSPIGEMVYAPDEWIRVMGDVAPLLASWHHEHLMGCALSGLLLAREADLTPTVGPVSTEAAKLHLERLNALGFQAAPLHCERYLLPEGRIAAFRQHYGRRSSVANEAMRSAAHESHPRFIPC